jgi:hypothetical protein
MDEQQKSQSGLVSALPGVRFRMESRKTNQHVGKASWPSRVSTIAISARTPSTGPSP